MPPMIAIITWPSARPWRSWSQLSMIRRAALTEIPSARPIRARADTHCQSVVAKTIQSSEAATRTQPEAIRRNSHPRSARGTSQMLPNRVMAKGMPARRPNDQVGKPYRSWISASRAKTTPIPEVNVAT